MRYVSNPKGLQILSEIWVEKCEFEAKPLYYIHTVSDWPSIWVANELVVGDTPLLHWEGDTLINATREGGNTLEPALDLSLVSNLKRIGAILDFRFPKFADFIKKCGIVDLGQEAPQMILYALPINYMHPHTLIDTILISELIH